MNSNQENYLNRIIKNPDKADPPQLVLLLPDQLFLVIIKNNCYLSQRQVKVKSAVPWKITAMLVRLAETISSKYYILLFPLNLIITIIVTCLLYSMSWSMFNYCIAPSLGGASPYSWLKVHLFQTEGIIRLNRTGISNLNWLFIQEMKSSVAQ